MSHAAAAALARLEPLGRAAARGACCKFGAGTFDAASTRATTPTRSRCAPCSPCWRAPSRPAAAAAAGAGRHAGAGREAPRLPCRARRRGRGQRRRPGLLCGPQMQALWDAAGAAQRGGTADGGARAASVAAALQSRATWSLVKGSLGSKHGACRRRHRWRQAAARRGAKMFYTCSTRWPDVFSPVNLFRYLTFRSVGAVPDGAVRSAS